jgi:hypothetical protein
LQAIGSKHALMTTGFAPGAYKLAIGFAVPNSEIVKESADSEKLSVCEETKNALRKPARGCEWAVTRTDECGRLTSWILMVRHLILQAQMARGYPSSQDQPRLPEFPTAKVSKPERIVRAPTLNLGPLAR